MSPRPRATFAKRQKEQARQEKQRAKAQRKQQRKLENPGGGSPIDFDNDQFSLGSDAGSATEKLQQSRSAAVKP